MTGSADDTRPVVLITGAEGLIGRRVRDRLSGDYRVACLDVEPPEDPQWRDRSFCGDLTDEDSTAEALRQVAQQYGPRWASVIHLAAYYDFSGEPSPLYDKLTVEGTRRLLRNLQSLEVDQFVFASSLLVMKPVEDADSPPIDENSSTQAEWPYPESKLAAEEVIAAERGDIDTVIMRVAGVFDEDCHSIPIAHQIKRIYEKQLQSHVFPGDQDHGQTFIHLDDLADAMHQAVRQRHELDRHELFLIAEDDLLSYGEMQDIIGREIHGAEEWTTVWAPKLLAKAGVWVQTKLPS